MVSFVNRDRNESKAAKPVAPAKVAKRAKAAKAVPRAKRGAGASLNGERARDREVMDTAVQIFWEKGYANTSVQDVADALGMLKGSLYYYIDSKESLLNRIFDYSHAEISKLTEAATASDEPAIQRLSRFLYDYAMWTLNHLERAGLYSREWRFASPELRITLSEHQGYYGRHLRELIEAGQAEGALDASVDSRHATLFIWAAFTGLPDWFRPAGRQNAAEVAESYVQLALRAAGRTAAEPGK